LDIAPAVAVIVGIGVVVLIVLIFVGFHCLKPESLKVSLKWNCFEMELRRPQSPSAPKRAIKR
jgi:hypothetical protein